MKKWLRESGYNKAIAFGCLVILVLVGWMVIPAVAAILEDARFGTLHVARTTTLVGALDVAAITCDSVASAGAISGTTISGTTLEASGTLTVTGDVTNYGNLTVDGTLSAYALGENIIAPPANTTNGHVIALAGIMVRLDSTGNTTNLTNTVTLANLASGATGMFYIINTGSTNSLAISQAGTFKSPAIALAPYEAAVILAPVSNAFYAVDF